MTFPFRKRDKPETGMIAAFQVKREIIPTGRDERAHPRKIILTRQGGGKSHRLIGQ